MGHLHSALLCCTASDVNVRKGGELGSYQMKQNEMNSRSDVELCLLSKMQEAIYKLVFMDDLEKALFVDR